MLGANGQLGTELVSLLGPDSSISKRELSITDEAAVDALFDERSPDLVFNCAAYNAVDRAESEPGQAYAVNEHGPAIIAAACVRFGARLVHFSTNFVFDGEHDRPYSESDHPAPLSVYGMSKLMGERRVLEAGPDFLVVRTAAVYGGPASFPARILERARSGEPLQVVADQRINPTYAADLAGAAVELARSGLSGLVHAVSEGCCGWDELARAVMSDFALQKPVESITSDSLGAPARRPRNGCLETSRFRPLRPWRDALHAWAGRVKEA